MATTDAPSPGEVTAGCEVAPCEGTVDRFVVDPASTTHFHSPSDNITCSLSEVAATCEIAERSFAPPPEPADCELDHGSMVSVSTAGTASFDCHGDTAFVQATPFGPDSPLVGYGDVLRYGGEVTNGVFVCSSSRKGMACSTVAGKHGFELSRAEYRLY